MVVCHYKKSTIGGRTAYRSIDMTFIIFLLVVGFITYWLIRHPIKTMKFTAAIIGLLLLGLLMTFVFITVTAMMIA